MSADAANVPLRECPACALDIPADAVDCPMCGYELPALPKGRRAGALGLAALMLLFAFPAVLAVC